MDRHLQASSLSILSFESAASPAQGEPSADKRAIIIITGGTAQDLQSNNNNATVVHMSRPSLPPPMMLANRLIYFSKTLLPLFGLYFDTSSHQKTILFRRQQCSRLSNLDRSTPILRLRSRMLQCQ
eukprot:8502931-Pyramimonas_sp.AAC.1